MNYVLRFQYKDDASGTVDILKKTDDGLKEVGGIAFNNEADRKWVIEVLDENHPNVSVEE